MGQITKLPTDDSIDREFSNELQRSVAKFMRDEMIQRDAAVVERMWEMRVALKFGNPQAAYEIASALIKDLEP